MYMQTAKEARELYWPSTRIRETDTGLRQLWIGHCEQCRSQVNQEDYLSQVACPNVLRPDYMNHSGPVADFICYVLICVRHTEAGVLTQSCSSLQ